MIIQHKGLIFNEEVVTNFRESFATHSDSITAFIAKLGRDPHNDATLDAIVNALHTIRTNSATCQLSLLTELTDAIEGVVISTQQAALQYSDTLGEMLLLCIDKARQLSEDLFAMREIDIDLLSAVEGNLHLLIEEPNEQTQYHIDEIIQLISGLKISKSNDLLPHSDPCTLAIKKDTTQSSATHLTDQQALSEPTRNSLFFFKQMATLLEDQVAHWSQRCERTLALALRLNQALAYPVPLHQLQAAVYMHDVSFAFLRSNLITKPGKYDSIERDTIRAHPKMSADLVQLIPGFEMATTMIMQHHEFWDGSGYPHGLKGEEITIGAQFIAMVDAYESMTHTRSDRQSKHSLLRAMTEIHNCSGTQFSPGLVNVFTEVIQNLIDDN